MDQKANEDLWRRPSREANGLAALRTALALGIVATTLLACNRDTIALRYRFDEGTVATYRMDATATAEWDIEGGGGGSYDISFTVSETIESITGDAATVVVDMQPESQDERGLPTPGLERRTFSLRLGPNGEVRAILNLDGVAGRQLDNEQLAFIGTYRPALPDVPVTLHDTWSARQEIASGATFQQLDTTGRLDALHRDTRGRIAEIEFTGEGPLRWETELPQGTALLDGDAHTRGDAIFDIDAGMLRSATSVTAGDFDVRIVPGEGQAPISGTLHLELELTIEEARGS